AIIGERRRHPPGPPALRTRALRRRWNVGEDADAGAILAEALVLDDAVDEREQRPVAPDADVRTGMDARADLADEDVAGAHLLPAVALDAAALPVRIASVSARALALLVRHQAISVTRTVVIDCRWPRRRR